MAVVTSTKDRADTAGVPGTINVSRSTGEPEVRIERTDGAVRWAGVPTDAIGGLVISEHFTLKPGATLPLPWASRDVSVAGAPVKDFVADAAGGQYQLALAADNEAEQIGIDFADQLIIDVTKDPVFHARVKINPDVTGGGGELGATDAIVVGLCSAYAAALDDIVINAWFRFHTDHKILVEADDGTTDTDDTDTGVVWVDDTFMDLSIDFTDLSAVKFSVNGVVVKLLSIPLATGTLQPCIYVQKAAAADLDHEVIADYVVVRVRN